MDQRMANSTIVYHRFDSIDSIKKMNHSSHNQMDPICVFSPNVEVSRF